MAVPKYDQLMNPTLEALHKLGGSASVAEIEDTVAALLNLSEKDLNETHRGSRTKFSYRLAWSRNYLKRYGLIENSTRGVWALTPRGAKIKEVDKAEVKRHVQALEKKARTGRKTKDKPVDPDLDTDAADTWKEELIKILKSIPPDSFERLCQRVLRECGFVQVEVTGRTGDGGIDGKGVVKIGGLLSFHAVFQCKRFSRSVAAKIIRDFRGAMIGRADKGLLLTTGTFTRQAKVEASRDGAPPIDLVDGDDLAQKLKDLGLGVDTEEIKTEKINIREDWFQNL